MGISIHFRGSLTDQCTLNSLVAEVKDICEIMNWEYQVADDDGSEPVDAHIVNENDEIKIEGNLGLKGIGFQPHEKSEWVNLYFDKNGTIFSFLSKLSLLENDVIKINVENWNSVKTQFAPVKTHIAVIKLLRHLKKKYLHNLEVNDEGEYWETNDPQILSSHIESIAKSMDLLQEKLENSQITEPQEQMSTEEYADYIAHLIENSTLETELKLRGGEMWKADDIDPFIHNQFMKNVIAFEDAADAPEIPMLSLFPPDYKFPPAESMTNSELSGKLEEITDILSNHNISLGFANDLPDKVIYNYLTQDCIPNDTISASVMADFTWVMDGCSGNCESCFQKEYCSTAKEM